MEKIIGDKRSFAIGIKILTYEPRLWGNSCIWLDNNKIGDFEDENVLAPFIRSLMRIAITYQELWYDDFDGLECEELFNTIFPFHNNPDKFYDLTPDNQKFYIRYDIFILEFGENFERWLITSVVQKNICKFLWVDTSSKESPTYEKGSYIRCFDVNLEHVRQVYRDLCAFIPDKYWPTSIEKLK